jgi:MazG family protein
MKRKQPTSSRFPPVPGGQFEEYVRIVRRLRRECPWDRTQTHRSLRDPLVEETYEVVEALDHNDLPGLRNELGDLLLHIVLQATIAEQHGEFTLRDVLAESAEKLVRRHPHVFARARVKDTADVLRNWERIKMEEGRDSVLQGVPEGLPSLQRALRVQERAAKVGFDWERPDDVWNKVREELDELRESLREGTVDDREEEFGDLLFALVNYARFLEINPENALRQTVRKFVKRFRHIERSLRDRGKTPQESTLEEMDALWEEAKRGERR